jgi:hypothetical protein
LGTLSRSTFETSKKRVHKREVNDGTNWEENRWKLVEDGAKAHGKNIITGKRGQGKGPWKSSVV